MRKLTYDQDFYLWKNGPLFHKQPILVSEKDSSKAVSRRCFVKKLFLKISQNSQENTRSSLFFNKVAG